MSSSYSLHRWSAHRWTIGLCILLCSLSTSVETFAHGNVVAEEDACVLQIGFYTAHFSAYQPRKSQHFEFCEDLPDVTETVFVINYLHDSMREVDVDMRILRDSRKLGRFARLEDIAQTDYTNDTVYYHPPVTQADAEFTALHSFSEPGDYIGIVTAMSPKGEKVYTAVFPFSVGAPQWLTYALSVAVVALLVVSAALGRRLLRQRSVVSSLTLLVVTVLHTQMLHADTKSDFQWQLSEPGSFRMGYRGSEGNIPLNRIHKWLLRVESDTGEPVNNAEISISGGMPVHEHGLPTAPRMTQNLGNGTYLIEGMKFHMPGHWQIEILVISPTITETTTFDLHL